MKNKNEIWKDVIGYEGIYEVSSFGRLRRSIVSNTGRNTWPGKILKQSVSGKYPHASLTKDGVSKTFDTHILVLNAFSGSCPRGFECRHLDDNKENNAISNLCWGSKEQNIDDARRNGKLVIGERQGAAKLTNKHIIEIRSKYKPYKYTMPMLAEEYRVRERTIEAVIYSESWRHVQ